VVASNLPSAIIVKQIKRKDALMAVVTVRPACSLLSGRIVDEVCAVTGFRNASDHCH
jgi:hypothetical protein